MIVIDHEGVIRHRNLRGEKLDLAIQDLVSLAETANQDG